MKNLHLLTLALLLSAGLVAQEMKSDYEVHEWGTFTTLSNSQGRQLTGLIRSEEPVPAFVHKIKTSWTTRIENPHSTKSFDQYIYTHHKTNIENVNCRMETPVLYFYSKNAPLKINKVRVDYSQGSVTEFFPNAHCEDLTQRGGVNLKTYRGYIEWNNISLMRDTDPMFTTTIRSQETPQWIAPRKTASNIVFTGNAQEKFLFYRGLGYIESRLITRFINPFQLEINNGYSEEVPFLFVFENKGEGRFEAFHIGGLDAGKNIKVNLKRPVINMNFGKDKMLEALVSEGLYRDEAMAMLETWKESYFETPGLKVLWIWPQQLVRDRLPIYFDPWPNAIKRVMVGRSEVLTPQQEAKIHDVYLKDKALKAYENDRFFLCYHDMLKTYQPYNFNIDFQNCLRLIVHPNPNAGFATATIEADCEAGNEVELWISDFTGRELFKETVSLVDKKAKISLPLQNEADGIYLITAKGETEKTTVRLVKAR